MKKSIFLSLILSIVMMGMMGFAQKARADMNIIVVTHGAASDGFWTVLKNGVEQAAEDLNVNVDYRSPETYDMPAMVQLVDAAVAASPDALVVSIPDTAALEDAITSAVDAGIPVFAINAGSDDFESLGAMRFFGQTEYEAGYGAGEKLKEAGGKRALCVNHEQGNISLELRCQGFTDAFGKTDLLAVSTDPTEIKNAVASAIASGDTYDTILAMGPISAEPALAALEEAGQSEQVNIAHFDLSPAMLAAIDEGKIMFAIDQQQYLQGYYGVLSAVLYVEYGFLPGNKVMSTGPGFVTADNAQQVLTLSAEGIR